MRALEISGGRAGGRGDGGFGGSSIFGSSIPWHSFQCFHFGWLSGVALLFHPCIEFGAEFGDFDGELRVMGKVLAVRWVGLAIVEFLRRAVLEIKNEPPCMGVACCGHFPLGLECRVFHGGVFKGGFRCEVANLAELFPAAE
jgi:hypothetical protein